MNITTRTKMNGSFAFALFALFSIFSQTNAYRVPVPGSTWQWQLSGSLDTSFDVCNYDIDLFDNSAAAIGALANSGKMVICYFSAGSYENWRPDKDQFPETLLGNNLSGWPGERYVDIRQFDLLRSIMGARMDLAVEKGCHAVEPDNIDAYLVSSGFPLTPNDQLQYNQMLAQMAHERNLSIALKNDIDQASALEPYFDFAINEECVRYNECSRLQPFVSAGKAVLHCEYRRSFVPCDSSPAGFSSIRKTLALTATPLINCPNEIQCGAEVTPPCRLDSECAAPIEPCSVAVCIDGSCSAMPKDCDDGDTCTADSCDAVTGMCVNTAIEGCWTPECVVAADCDYIQDRCVGNTVCVNGRCLCQPQECEPQECEPQECEPQPCVLYPMDINVHLEPCNDNPQMYCV